MNEPKVGSQDLTPLDEFERNAEVVVGILQSSLTRIDKWIKDLQKYSGTGCRLIPQRTRDDVIKILDSFRPFADAFPKILLFLTTYYITEFKGKVEGGYSNINDKIQEIVRKCSHYPYPSVQPLYIEMCGLRHDIENLSEVLSFCVRTAREDLAVRMQPATSSNAGDGDKKPEAENTLGNISGMRWQDAQKKAKKIVAKYGFKGFEKLRKPVGCSKGTLRKAKKIVAKYGFKGFEKLRKPVGCSKGTLRKAIDESDELTEAETQYKSMPGTLKAVGLTSKVVATYENSSEELLPSEVEANEILDELLKQTKKEKPQMLEQTKKELDEMDSDSRRKLANAYKNINLEEDPKTQRQHKKV